MSVWNVSLVREQGVEFAVVLVKDNAVDNQSTASGLIQAFSLELGRPVVLLGERRSQYYGRNDLVRFLSHVHPSRLPWRKMTIAA